MYGRDSHQTPSKQRQERCRRRSWKCLLGKQRHKPGQYQYEPPISAMETIKSAILITPVIGAGVLAMPLALSHMGILLGTIVILWAGLTAGFGLYLQTRCAQYLERGSASFFALSQITYPNAAVIFDAAIAIKCFGVGVSYLIIIGDLMPGVVRGFNNTIRDNNFLVDRHFWVTGFM
jgi:amino acid permease